MNRPRSLLRNPLIRRVQRHPMVATMMHKPASLIQTTRIMPAPLEILPAPVQFPEESDPMQESGFSHDLTPSASLPSTPTPQPIPDPPQRSVSRASSAPVQKKSWSIPNIFKRWQEGRAAKTEKAKSSIPQAVPIQTPASPIVPAVVQTKYIPSAVPLQNPVQPPDVSASTVETPQDTPQIQRHPTASPPQPGPYPVQPSSLPSHLSASTPSTPTAQSYPQALGLPPVSGQVQAGSASATPLPSPPLPAEPGNEDTNWRRLQTIMRKHQEKQTLESENEPVSSEPVQSVKTEPETPREKGQSASPPSPPPPLQRQEQPRTTPIRPPTPAIVEYISKSETPSTSSVPTQQLSTLEPESNQPETSSSTEVPALENAWPVQKRKEKIYGEKPVSLSATIPTPSTPPPAKTLHPEEEEVFRKVNEAIKTTQPTDSHVEVLPPRNARPPSLQRASPPSPARATEHPPPSTSLQPALTDPEPPRQESKHPVSARTTVQNLPPAPVQSASSDSELQSFPSSSSTGGQSLASRQPASDLPETNLTMPIATEQTQPRPAESTVPVPTDTVAPPSNALETSARLALTSSPPIQRTPLSSSVPPAITPTITETSSSEGPALNPSSPQQEQEPAPTLIPTDIGPLPGDLWQLIGQTPPTPHPSKALSSQEPSTSTSYTSSSQLVQRIPKNLSANQPVIQSAYPSTMQSSYPPSVEPSSSQTAHSISHQAAKLFGPSSSPNIETPGDAPAMPQKALVRHQVENVIQPAAVHPILPTYPAPIPQTTLIQRAEAGEPESQALSSTLNQQETTTEQSPTLSEQDLDKIARQVYSEIRQKISIEYERSRGWMG